MATTENLLNGTGSQTDFAFTFPYIKASDIKVSVGSVAKTVTTHYTLHNATTIRFTSGNIPPSGTGNVRIYRETDDSSLEATFYPGSAIKAGDLNDNFTQNLYVVQEGNNKIESAWQTGDETIDSTETWYTTDDNRVATTKAIENRINSQIDAALVNDVVAGTDIAIADDTPSSGKITINHSVGGANTTVDNGNGVVLQDIAITAQGHVTSVGSINLDGRYYTETELNAGQLDNRYYTETETGALIDSKIDTALSSDVLAGQSITKSASGGQVTISIADGAITGDQIGVDAVGASELADNAVASANIIDGSIVNADINASANIAGSKLADDSVTLAKLGSGALPTDITIASANIVNGTIVDADIATGTLDNRYFTETELTGGALDGRYYTETESDARYFNISTGDTIKDGDTFPDNDTTIATTAAINDRIIDLVDDVGGFVPIANETSFPNANPDVNNGAGTLVSIKALSSNLTSNGSGVATISNGTVGNSTVTITGLANSTTYAATFGMIVETTSTLNTYTFHRQVPKATEVSTVAGSISNVNTVAGAISNVNAVASNATNINAVAGNNSNITSVAGNSSNINSAVSNASNINSAVSNATNINSAVSNASNINTVAGSISNVNTVATNISDVNDFSDKYRVASSAPTSNNDAGDLYFDTSSNELRVYNGSSWQGGVTATGNLAGLGANTFTGNQSLGDNIKVIFGTGGDLEIYHDGSNSYLVNTTGELQLRDESRIRLRTDQFVLNNHANDESIIYAAANGATELYYDNSKKFETTSYGVLISSRLNAQTINIEDWNSTHETGAIKLGTSNDLQIYHDGTNTHLHNATGELKIRGNDVRLMNAAGNELYFAGFANSYSALYYDNSKKFETTSGGVNISGSVTASSTIKTSDSAEFIAGDGNDLRLWHNGTDSYIKNYTGDLWIQGDGDDIHMRAADDITLYTQTSDTAIVCVGDGAVELYYNNTWRFKTENWGVSINGNISLGDNEYLNVGASNDLQIYFDGESRVKNVGTASSLYLQTHRGGLINEAASEWGVLFEQNAAVRLYYDGSQKLATLSNGIDVTGKVDITGGHLYLDDNYAARFGTGEDLLIYHDGSHSNVQNSTGNLHLRSTANCYIQVGDGSGGWENALRSYPSGAVELHYDDVKKLETNSGGVNVVGTLTVNGAALSSSPTVQGTATGAITAEKAVCVKSNGTFEQVAVTESIELGPEQGATDYQMHDSMPYDSWIDSAVDSNGYIVFVFRAEGGGHAYYKLGKANSAGTIEWYRTAFGNTYEPNSPTFTACHAGKTSGGNPCFLLSAYRNGAGQSCGAKPQDADTNSGTLGKNLERAGVTAFVPTDNKYDFVFNTSDNKFYACFSGNGTGYTTDRQYLRPGSVADAGLGVTGGTAVGGGAANTGGAAVKACIDPSTQNIFTFVVKSNTVKMIPWTWNSLNSTYSEGTMVDVVSSVYSVDGKNMQCVFDSGNNKIVVLYSHSDEDGRVIVGDVSGTTVTWGTGIEYLNQNVGGCTIAYDSNIGRIFIAARNEGNSSRPQGYIGVTSGSGSSSTITINTGNATTIDHDGSNYEATQYMTSVFDPSYNRMIFGWARDNDSDRGAIAIMKLGDKTTNATASNFIGFAKDTVSNGATSTVNVVGSTTTQSSLTPGQIHYLQMDGTVSTTAAPSSSGINEVIAGRALSTTKLLIQPV